MDSILTFVEKLYNSIRYNGFYIIMTLFFPLLIWKLDAGRELFTAMGEQPVGNIIFSLTAFAALGFSIWAIPTLAISFFVWLIFSGSRDKDLRKKLFEEMVKLDNGSDAVASGNMTRSQVPIRYFSIFPWTIFIVECCQVYFSTLSTIIVLAILIIGIIVAEKWMNRWKKTKTGGFVPFFEWLLPKQNWTIILTFAVVLSVLIAANIRSFTGEWGSADKDTTLNVILMVLVNCIGMLLYYLVILFLETKEWEPVEQHRISNLTYSMLVFFVISIFITYYFLNDHQVIQYISPVFVIINMCTAIIVFIEFFIIAQFLLIYITGKKIDPAVITGRERRLKVYKYMMILVTLLIIRFAVLASLNEHRIWISPVSLSNPVLSSRQTLEDYFKHWEAGRSSTAKQDSTIYLVSAQGGGSRAAAWAFINLARLDSVNPGTFFNNLFSISAVSGSTSGVNMFLAAKYYHCPINIKNNVLDLYGVNYMSSAFYGLMLGDGLESVLDRFSSQVRDRNYHLQQEEIKAFNDAFDRKDKSNAFFETDFMYPYTNTHTDTVHFPLFMINTTLLDYGTRAVFSPVKLDSFSMARDIYGEFRKDNCNDKRDIPMISCVNQSQAFPIISAYNYLECTGRLGDGGFSENSGCGTTLEIYRALRQYFDRTTAYQNFRIVCINLMNSSMADSRSAPFTPATALTTLTAAMHSPFDGNQNYAYKNLPLQMQYMQSVNKIANRDTFYNYNLDASITLTRTLSKKSIQNMLDHEMKRSYTLK